MALKIATLIVPLKRWIFSSEHFCIMAKLSQNQSLFGIFGH